ncbi:hypothetical protein FRB99_007004 [Tulasnella sp. 403]|nr:hypothetical protein FRB99_007004 [Tulasnella sp. 403]
MKVELDDITAKLPWSSPEETKVGLEYLNRIAGNVQPGELVAFLGELLRAKHNLFDYAITGATALQALLKRLSAIVHSIPSKIAPRPDFSGEDVVAAVISLTDNISDLRRAANLQDNRKLGRALRSVSASKDPYAVLVLKPPRNAKEVAELANDLENKTLEMIESFLEVLASQRVAEHVQGLASNPDGKKIPQEQSTTFHEASTYANAHGITAPDSSLLYLHDAGGATSLWCIKMPQRVLGQLRQLNRADATTYARVQDQIKELSTGNFSQNNHIPVTDDRLGPQIYKARVNGDRRLVYMVDCEVIAEGNMEDPHEIQFIRILGIYDHDKVDERFWGSVSSVFGRRGEDYRKRCRARSDAFRGSGTLPPMVFSRAGDREAQHTDSAAETRYGSFYGAGLSHSNGAENEDQIDEGFKQLHRIVSLEKLVPVSQKLFAEGHHESSFVFDLKPQERKVIEHPSSSIVLGRSGTGKTTTMLFKVLALEIQSQKSDVKIRQLFVTQSRTLAKKVAEYFHSLVDTIQDNKSGDTRTTWVSNTRPLSIRDMDNESTPITEVDRPSRFSELRDVHFPLFLAFDELCVLLAGDCPPGTITPLSIPTRTLNALPFQPFISFDDGFLSTIWPRFNKKHKKGLDPALVYSEIVGVIKGSGRILDRKSYEDMSHRRHGTFANDRSRIYSLFEAYEKMKPRPSYDVADRTRRLLQSVKLSKSTLLDYVYVDEIQDNLIIDAALLRGLCRNPHGLFFTGDTAQTISVGSDFRFAELKDFLYAHERRAGRRAVPVDPEYFELHVNYRSHRGIVNAAAELVTLMNRFFPSSIDCLTRETATVDGPEPMFITNRSDDSGLRHMIYAKGTGRPGLGAEQAILVRNRAAAERLKQTVGRASIVLTIYESKGMEFDDVLLYDFFADSLASPRSWRALCRAASVGDFDRKSHAVLQSELKCLYVGLTRARYCVWLWDRTDIGADMEHLMVSRGLAVNLSSSATPPSIAALSTPQEWEKQGRELFSKRLYDEAAYCFSQAGLKWLHTVSLAFDARKTARKLPTGTEERRNGFEEAGRQFRSVGVANECTIPDDHQLLLTNAGECFADADNHASAGEAFLEAHNYTKAAWHFRAAERYDDAANVVSHYSVEIDPAILDKVKYVIQAIYTKRGQLRKARALFSSANDYTSFMDDQGFVDQKVAFLESQAAHDKAAEVLWQQGKHSEAIRHFLCSTTPSAKLKAVPCLMEGLRVSFPFGAESNVSINARRELLSIADSDVLALSREQRVEVGLFRAISSSVGIYAGEARLVHLAERFYKKGNFRCALLAYHSWAHTHGLPRLKEGSTDDVISTLNKYRLYFQTIREVARIPNIASQQVYHGTFGILGGQSITQAGQGASQTGDTLPDELVLSSHSFAFQEANSHLAGTEKHIRNSRDVRLPSQILSDTISTALRFRLNTCVQKLHSHCLEDSVFQIPPENHVSVGHYNASFGILLLLIATLDSQVVLGPEDCTRRQGMQKEWLGQVFSQLYPQDMRDYGIANVVPSLIPHFEETLPTLKMWVQDYFDSQRPDVQGLQFLTNILTSAMIGSVFDYEGTQHYHPRGQWSEDRRIAEQYHLIATINPTRHPRDVLRVESLLAWFAQSHPARHNCGVGFICHVIEKRVVVDLDVFIPFIEEVCCQLIFNHYAHRRGEARYVGMTLPRSWMLRVAAQGKSSRPNGVQPYKLLPALATFIGILDQPDNGMHVKETPLQRVDLQVRGRLVLKMCYVIALLGCSNSKLAPKVVELFTNASRHSQAASGFSFFLKNSPNNPFFDVQNWDDVWRTLILVSEEVSQSNGGLITITDHTALRNRLFTPQTQNIAFNDMTDLVTQCTIGNGVPWLAMLVQSSTGLLSHQAQLAVDNRELDDPGIDEADDLDADGLTHIARTPKEEAGARLIQACFRRYRRRSGFKLGGPLYDPFCELVKTLKDRSPQHPPNYRLFLYCVLLRGPLIHCMNELQRLKELCENAIRALNEQMARSEDDALDDVYERGKEIRSGSIQFMTAGIDLTVKEAIEALANTLGPESTLHVDNPSLSKLKAQVKRIPDLRHRTLQFTPIQDDSDDNDLGVTFILDMLSSKTARRQG